MPCTQYQLLMRTSLQTTASTHVWLLKEERVTRSFEVRVETRRQILRTGYTVFLLGMGRNNAIVPTAYPTGGTNGIGPLFAL